MPTSSPSQNRWPTPCCPTRKAPLQAMLAQAAREHGVWVIGGTLPIQSHEPDRVFNTTLVFNPQGQRMARYDKIHLFWLRRRSARLQRSRHLTPGNAPSPSNYTIVRARPTHRLERVHDLRFPELFRTMGSSPSAGSDRAARRFHLPHGPGPLGIVATCPSRGKPVPRAGAGQGANTKRSPHLWSFTGHWPWGEVLACQDEGPWVVMAELSRARQNEVRTQLPALQHRVL